MVRFRADRLDGSTCTNSILPHLQGKSCCWERPGFMQCIASPLNRQPCSRDLFPQPKRLSGFPPLLCACQGEINQFSAGPALQHAITPNSRNGLACTAQADCDKRKSDVSATFKRWAPSSVVSHRPIATSFNHVSLGLRQVPPAFQPNCAGTALSSLEMPSRCRSAKGVSRFRPEAMQPGGKHRETLRETPGLGNIQATSV